MVILYKVTQYNLWDTFSLQVPQGCVQLKNAYNIELIHKLKIKYQCYLSWNNNTSLSVSPKYFLFNQKF